MLELSRPLRTGARSDDASLINLFSLSKKFREVDALHPNPAKLRALGLTATPLSRFALRVPELGCRMLCPAFGSLTPSRPH